MLHLIAALGNPGKEYETTRHNAGWILIDAFTAKLGLTWKKEEKFQAMTACAEVNGKKIWLLKPMTMMNLSGASVQAFFNYHGFKFEELMVVHDEVAFESCWLKLAFGGGSGGHNGVGDIIQRLGTQEFWRLRLGTGPRNPMLTLTEWVLGPLSREEQSWFSSPEAIDVINLIVDKGPRVAQNTLNLS